MVMSGEEWWGEGEWCEKGWGEGSNLGEVVW